MKVCPDCQYRNLPGAVFCENCGFRLQSTTEPKQEAKDRDNANRVVAAGTCSACGQQNTPGETFCQNCGVQLSPFPSTPPPPPVPYTGTSNQPTPSQNNLTISSDTNPITCLECGHLNNSGEVFCSNCGLQIISPDQEQSSAPVQQRDTPGLKSTLNPAMIPEPDDKLFREPCPSCEFINVPGEPFCQNCGLPLSPGSAGAKLTDQGLNKENSGFPDQPVDIPLICPSCGLHLTGIEAYCQNCGYQMDISSTPVETSAGVSSSFETNTFDTIAPPAKNQPGITGRFITEDTAREVPYPAGKSEIIIGRADPDLEIYPDMDLTAFGGEIGGISRQHARLLRIGDHLLLEDLRSTNLTFLNTLRLNPGEQHLITDGDKIRLGGVTLLYKE